MSKELEALEKIKNLYKSYIDKIGLGANDIMGFDFSIMEIEKALIDKEKQDKALKIIKKKEIDVEDFHIYFTFSLFNQRRTLRGLFPISKEDYVLLKEILCPRRK